MKPSFGVNLSEFEMKLSSTYNILLMSKITLWYTKGFRESRERISLMFLLAAWKEITLKAFSTTSIRLLFSKLS
jgi:hypothetical protein